MWRNRKMRSHSKRNQWRPMVRWHHSFNGHKSGPVIRNYFSGDALTLRWDRSGLVSPMHDSQCVIFNSSFYFSGPQFSHLPKGNNSAFLPWLLWNQRKQWIWTCLEQHLLRSMYKLSNYLLALNPDSQVNSASPLLPQESLSPLSLLGHSIAFSS